MNLQKAVDLWDAAQANKNQYAKLRPIARSSVKITHNQRRFTQIVRKTIKK